ncbi:MAG TPA: hypothetical protein IAC31_02150 [Candidatus Faecousia intestinigallinarum]|nr:hypothetical protein [Candidatus Faecousia intestinigallinarum]
MVNPTSPKRRMLDLFLDAALALAILTGLLTAVWFVATALNVAANTK